MSQSQFSVEFPGQISAEINTESFEMSTVSLHPSIDNGVSSVLSLTGTTLTCLCTRDKVEVGVDAQIHHNHLCGCSKCWKPSGALLAQTAVAAANAVHVRAHTAKLACVDPLQSVKRFACIACGTHMLGLVEDPDHHFYGLTFIHPELSHDGVPAPEFAGFVSSVIETDTSPSLMKAARDRLTVLGIPAYDVFSPELMDIIAWHKVKLARSKSPRA